MLFKPKIYMTKKFLTGQLTRANTQCHYQSILSFSEQCLIGKVVVARPPYDCVLVKYYIYFSSKTYVVGSQKNRLNETVLLMTPNTC